MFLAAIFLVIIIIKARYLLYLHPTYRPDCTTVTEPGCKSDPREGIVSQYRERERERERERGDIMKKIIRS